MVKVKQNLSSEGGCMYTELQAVFDLSKTTYLDLITNHADTVCRQYLTLCYELKNDVIPVNKR